MAKERKAKSIRDPRKYAYAIERGLSEKNIPARPLFQKTLDEYFPTLQKKIEKVQGLILAAWS